jgi:hypothetical protein
MSNSLKPRVVRKHSTKQLFKASNYRKTLPLLLEDFDQRCAYSLVHIKGIGTSQMHVDHHDPRKKKKSPYANLFPAYGLCNGAKGDSWPSTELQKQGVRFLNPCVETDYNHQIFEDPDTHDLIATTAAADYHITMLDLNNPALVTQRMERAVFAKMIASPAICRGKSPSSDATTAAILRSFLDIQTTKIPPILPPPGKSRTA